MVTIEGAWQWICTQHNPSATDKDQDELAQEIGISNSDLSSFVAEQLNELLEHMDDEDIADTNVFVQLLKATEDLEDAEPVYLIPLLNMLSSFKFGFLTGAAYQRLNTAELENIPTQQG